MRACLWLLILAASSTITVAAETTNLVEILRRFQAELDLRDGRTPAAVGVEIPPDTQTAVKLQVSVAPREYRLRAGDWVRVQIENEPGLSTDRTEVAQDGTIRLPIVGPVLVAGTTVAEATQIIRQLLERDYLVDPRVAFERLRSESSLESAPEVGGQSPNVAPAKPAERAASAPVAGPSEASHLADPPSQKPAGAVASPALSPAVTKVDALDPPPAPRETGPTERTGTPILVEAITPPQREDSSPTPSDEMVPPDSPTTVTKVDTLEPPPAPRETDTTEQTGTPTLAEAITPAQREGSSLTPPDEMVPPDSPTTVTKVDTLEPPPAPVVAVSTKQDTDSPVVESAAPPTTEGDSAEATLYLVLTNQVAKPGKYPWTGEGMTLRIALETAGGPTAQADLGRVLVRRLIRGEQRQLEVNLEHPSEAWRSGALLLKPGDIVEVPVRK